MTKEEAIQAIKEKMDYYESDKRLRGAIETLIPELKENEDERIRKFICSIIDNLEPKDFVGVKKMNVLAWLEKQKEQPQEELVYRMNGLMQEYIKEGEDDAEKEHRLKCYQLFWDALEDADFFEQKKQKPSINIDQLKSLMLQYLQEAANEKEDSNIEADTDKWAKKILGYGFKQKPTEWSEEDEKIKDYIIHALTNNTHAKEQGPVLYAKEIDWLKSLRPQYHGDVTMTEAYKMGLEAGKASSWKPSEEQMEALSETIAFAPDTFKPKCTLVTLQDDLKNL